MIDTTPLANSVAALHHYPDQAKPESDGVYCYYIQRRISSVISGKEMIAEAEVHFGRTLLVDYETDCLSVVSARYPLYHCLVSDLIWSEIDTPSDMRHTQDTVYPAIVKQAQVSENFEISQPGQRPLQPDSGYTFEPGSGNNI